MASGWLICAATRMELEAAWKALVPEQVMPQQDLHSPLRSYAGGPWFLVCGAGMPQALLRLTEALRSLQPTAVLQVGLAGAFENGESNLAIGDLVAVTQEFLGDLGMELPVQNSVGFSPLNEAKWAEPSACGPFALATWPQAAREFWPGLKRAYGLTVNCVTGSEQTASLRKALGEAWVKQAATHAVREKTEDVDASASLLGVETMEGAALAMACNQAGIPGFELRAISNRVGHRDMVPAHFQKALGSLERGLTAMKSLFEDSAMGLAQRPADLLAQSRSTTARRTIQLSLRKPLHLSVAISPCPNDVFIFAGILVGAVKVPGIAFDFLFEDIEALNRRASSGEAGLIKISFANIPHCASTHRLLRCGGALGYGCGPLLLTGGAPFDVTREILLPGETTTAHALWNAYARSAWPGVDVHKRFQRFDAIYETLCSQRQAQGVVIHEMRFTYERAGLHLVQDLGAFWEKETGAPIPLGGLVLKRDAGLPIEVVEAVVRESLAWSYAHEKQALACCQQYAQSMDQQVMRSHIDLYVNDFTEDIGEQGERAVTKFLSKLGFHQNPFS